MKQICVQGENIMPGAHVRTHLAQQQHTATGRRVPVQAYWVDADPRRERARVGCFEHERRRLHMRACVCARTRTYREHVDERVVHIEFDNNRTCVVADPAFGLQFIESTRACTA